ncbi:hypothetical protein AUR64_09365 [Haloprofundus marisrubri]|uniref:Uncharacterized protein n=1 Tax=Haloprofundus marisrubri TaxID=1514971 RepID=A0A0W1R836_9EURY|nr:hypothetical protein [Haloprofundus marisrubri]KTG09828.1 hypothetical protein AUR64_09365 [Haloprofundus marisrubri]
MATIVYESPDGIAEDEVPAENISDSGKVAGVRVKHDEGYLHLPYGRVYSIRTSEKGGKVDYSSP